jgi:hypothetical protein
MSPATPLLLNVNPGLAEPPRTTWAAFTADNAEYLEPGEIDLIAAVLAGGGTYFGDQGAGGRWTVEAAS